MKKKFTTKSLSVGGIMPAATSPRSGLQATRRGVAVTACALLTCWAPAVAAQTPFQNLNFEAATFVPVPNDPYQRVAADAALPGWTAFARSNPLTSVLHNDAFLSTSIVAVEEPSYHFFPGPAFSGNYSALLEAGDWLENTTLTADVTLAQTGTVPQGTRSLRFLAEVGPTTSFQVSLGGANLSLIALPGPQTYIHLYEADIGALSGTTVPLQFTVFAPSRDLIPSYLYLDDIQFSPVPVPEPSVSALLAIGAGLLAGVTARLRLRARTK